MPEIMASELTEDDVVLETWTESDPPVKIPLRIMNIVREDDVVDVMFMTGKSFRYDANDQVEVQIR